mmetsp:Transcript_23561/g.82013  ORF Transcript_23561/g.82013 Transcript_23561/m.82013 type:complete len:284 (-) Transcript_23561:599-1450(-)
MPSIATKSSGVRLSAIAASPAAPNARASSTVGRPNTGPLGEGGPDDTPGPPLNSATNELAMESKAGATRALKPCMKQFTSSEGVLPAAELCVPTTTRTYEVFSPSAPPPPGAAPSTDTPAGRRPAAASAEPLSAQLWSSRTRLSPRPRSLEESAAPPAPPTAVPAAAPAEAAPSVRPTPPPSPSPRRASSTQKSEKTAALCIALVTKLRRSEPSISASPSPSSPGVSSNSSSDGMCTEMQSPSSPLPLVSCTSRFVRRTRTRAETCSTQSASTRRPTSASPSS